MHSFLERYYYNQNYEHWIYIVRICAVTVREALRVLRWIQFRSQGEKHMRLSGISGVCHAPRAFKMAGVISKQGGQSSNLFPRQNRTESDICLRNARPFKYSDSPVERRTIIKTRLRAARFYREWKRTRRLDESRVRRKMECVYINVVSMYWARRFTRGHSASELARARCVIIASRNCCDIVTCLCAILSYCNVVISIRREWKEKKESEREKKRRRCRAAPVTPFAYSTRGLWRAGGIEVMFVFSSARRLTGNERRKGVTWHRKWHSVVTIRLCVRRSRSSSSFC